MVCTFISAKPLDFRYPGLVVVMVNPHSLTKACISLLANGMLSDIISSRIP